MNRGSAARSEMTEMEPGESVLGRGARVRGRVGGEGDLRVEGQVEGEVRISGQLAIEEGGAVAGDVEAAAVVIAGSLAGDIAARGPVTIRATAKVEGNIVGQGAEVVLEEGASYEGRIDAEFELPAELGGSPAAPKQAARGR
jgi:cytoskeletal protein CcmA (bactofilin family)